MLPRPTGRLAACAVAACLAACGVIAPTSTPTWTRPCTNNVAVGSPPCTSRSSDQLSSVVGLTRVEDYISDRSLAIASGGEAIALRRGVRCG